MDRYINIINESFTKKLEESRSFNFSAAARKVAEMAVKDFKKGPDVRKLKKKLREISTDLPVDKIVNNLCQIVYKKYFNFYKKPNRGYLEPFSSEEEMINYYNKYGKNELSAYDVKYKNGKVMVAIDTQFIDYVMYSYYVVYDEQAPDEVYSCSAADFNAKR